MSDAQPSDVTIADHELIRPIGRGSYGEVWLARNVMGGPRAVKIVRASAFDDPRPFDREFAGLQKFEPISRSHPGLIQVLHGGRFESGFYYVMELADAAGDEKEEGRTGEPGLPTAVPAPSSVPPCLPQVPGSLATYSPRTLRSELRRRGRLPAAECVGLGMRLSAALGHLHNHGLVHRDLKPSNIIFVQGQPKLADIGLVAAVDATMSCVGTEGYLPPEGPGRPSADLYALGKVLYELATGRDRTDFPELPTLLREDAEREALEELNEVILKACGTTPEERYASAEELHADLALLNSGRSVRRRRRLEGQVAVLTRVALIVGLAALVGFGAYVFQRQQTGEARRLLQENRRLIESEAHQRHRAEQALLTVQLSRAQELLDQRKDSAALAHLGQLLRQHPTNRFIAEHILATLSQGSFALPIARLSHSNMIHAAFSRDGASILTEFEDGTAQIFDARTGQPSLPPIRHDADVLWIEFSPDQEWVASATRQAVRVSSTRTGQVRVSFALPDQMNRLVFSPDGSTLLVVCDQEAWIHDARTGERLTGPFRHGGRIDWAVFNLAGGRLLTFSKQSATVRVWDTASGQPVAGPFEHSPLRFFSIRPKLSADGTRVLTVLTTQSPERSWPGAPAVLDDGTAARLWSVKTGQPLSPIIERTSSIRCIEFSRDGTRMFISCSDREGWIYDGWTGQQLVGPLRQEEVLTAAAFSHDGRQLATGYGDTFVSLWDTTSGALLGQPLMQGFEITSVSVIRTLEFSPDGGRLLLRSLGTAWLWDVGTGLSRSRVLKHQEPVTYAEFSRDGQRIATAMDEQVTSGIRGRSTRGNSAQVWDVRSGQPIGTPLQHTRGVTTAVFSPDGSRVLTASRDRSARLWSAQTGEPIGLPMLHRRAVLSAGFAENGRRLWTGCGGHSAWLWDATGGELLSDLLGSEGEPLEFLGSPVRSDELSRDESWLLTCGRVPDGQGKRPATGVQVWDVRTGKPRWAAPLVTSTMRTARFSPDGERFVSTAYPGAAFVWSARTGELLAGPLQHEGRAVYFAQFSPDGTRILTAGDRAACVWVTEGYRRIGQPMVHQGEVIHAEFSPDGNRVVTAAWTDRAAFLWDAETGFRLGGPLQHEDWVTHVAVSPDGRRVVTTSADKTARVWDITTIPGSVPAWVADLAEAVAGQRIDAAGVRHPVPLDRLLELRKQLAGGVDADPCSQWAAWFFADRPVRPLSSMASLEPPIRSAAAAE